LRKPGWERHLEGWQLGFVVVGIALVCALLVVPRAAEPHSVPVPFVDRREQSWNDQNDIQLVRAAYASELPFEVRTVGERLRRYGAAVAGKDHSRAAAELTQLREAVVTARAGHGDSPLVILRAVQTQLFLQALQCWEAGGRGDAALRELGGDFLRTSRANGWISGRRLVLTQRERRVLFRVRWARLTGLDEEPPYAPTLNEWRTYYRFLLDHPELGRVRHRGGPPEALLMSYVAALERLDPSYPALLARGILQYRTGQYAAAARSFRSYLDQHPEAVRRVWARSFLLAASRRASGGAPDALVW